jgi:hypothetical protein
MSPYARGKAMSGTDDATTSSRLLKAAPWIAVAVICVLIVIIVVVLAIPESKREETDDATTSSTLLKAAPKIAFAMICVLCVIIAVIYAIRQTKQSDDTDVTSETEELLAVVSPTCDRSCNTHPYQTASGKSGDTGDMTNFNTFADSCAAAGGVARGAVTETRIPGTFNFQIANKACTCECVRELDGTPLYDISQEFIAPDGTYYNPSITGGSSVQSITTCIPTNEAELNPGVIFPGGTSPDPYRVVVPRGKLCDAQPSLGVGVFNRNLNMRDEPVGFDRFESPYGACPNTAIASNYQEAINLASGSYQAPDGETDPCASLSSAVCSSNYVASSGVRGNFYSNCTLRGEGCVTGQRCYLQNYDVECQGDARVDGCKNVRVPTTRGFVLHLTIRGSIPGLQVRFHPYATCATSTSAAAGSITGEGGGVCRQRVNPQLSQDGVQKFTIRMVTAPQQTSGDAQLLEDVFVGRLSQGITFLPENVSYAVGAVDSQSAVDWRNGDNDFGNVQVTPGDFKLYNLGRNLGNFPESSQIDGFNHIHVVLQF